MHGCSSELAPGEPRWPSGEPDLVRCGEPESAVHDHLGGGWMVFRVTGEKDVGGGTQLGLLARLGPGPSDPLLQHKSTRGMNHPYDAQVFPATHL